MSRGVEEVDGYDDGDEHELHDDDDEEAALTTAESVVVVVPIVHLLVVPHSAFLVANGNNSDPASVLRSVLHAAVPDHAHVFAQHLV